MPCSDMTGYMAEMRRLVGHRTIIQCAASVIVADPQRTAVRTGVEVSLHQMTRRRGVFAPPVVFEQKLAFYFLRHYLLVDSETVHRAGAVLAPRGQDDGGEIVVVR